MDKYKIYLDEKGETHIKSVMDIDTILKELLEYIKDIEAENKELKNEIHNYSKDEEIQKYKDELLNVKLNSLYILSTEEKKIANDFKKEHYEKCGKNGRMRYILTPTEIGTGIDIECSCCGEKKDISDYGRW